MENQEFNAKQTLARTIYGEARGEYNKLNGGIAALMAVGCVIRNRVVKKIEDHYMPHLIDLHIIQACRKPLQFSCWNENDPNLKVILQSDDILNKNSIYQLCERISLTFIDDLHLFHRKIDKYLLPDITKGADHYFADSLAKPPSWAKNMTNTFKIGAHSFWKS